MQIGYVQTSDDERTLDLQLEALREAGCDRIFTDGSGEGSLAIRDRPGFAEMSKLLGQGDVLVVWRLDRVGRSASDLISLLASIDSRGIEFRSLVDGIDTTSASGQSLFQVIDALARVERGRVGDRTRAGLHAAKMRGKRLGRPPALTNEQIAWAKDAIASKRETVTGMAAILGVNRSTVQRAIGSRR